jgi:hypothetical protein
MNNRRGLLLTTAVLLVVFLSAAVLAGILHRHDNSHDHNKCAICLLYSSLSLGQLTVISLWALLSVSVIRFFAAPRAFPRRLSLIKVTRAPPLPY